MTITVHRHVAGSYCVIVRNCDGEHYIDARRDLRKNSTDIEVVHNGQVRHHERIRNDQAPARLIELTRKELL